MCVYIYLYTFFSCILQTANEEFSLQFEICIAFFIMHMAINTSSDNLLLLSCKAVDPDLVALVFVFFFDKKKTNNMLLVLLIKLLTY